MMKAVLFDVDGVLLDSFEANLKFFQDLMVHFGYPSPTRDDYLPFFHGTMRTTIEGLTHAPEEEVVKIWEAGRQQVVPYPSHLLRIPEGSEETIDALSKQYILGIVTSRVRESVYTLPQLQKLQHYFRALVTYQDTENHKPHPDPLLSALTQLGVSPDVSVYVGDVENDIVAARSAGMKVVLYAKEQVDGADAWTTSFQELPAIIQSL